ncbi:MAG: secretin N-terminal domain-containing protein [Pseudomonadota bacterium]
MTAMRHLRALALALLVAGCATNPPFEEAKKLLGRGQTEQGLRLLETAVQEHPDDDHARRYYQSVRDIYANDLAAQADALANQGRYESAEAVYLKALAASPNHPPALGGLERVRREKRHEPMLAQAQQALARGDYRAAEAPARTVLQENPSSLAARRILAEAGESRQAEDAPARSLKGMLAKTVTLEFREASLKSVFEVLSRTAGVNFVFDKDVKQDIKVTIFVRDSSIDDVIKLITLTNQLDRKVLNDNSLLIYPATAAKQKEYQELMVKTFYLANADVKSAQSLIKTVVKSKDVYVDEKLNMLVLKDTPEAIRLAEKLIGLQDKAEPEVMLQVEVLEVGSGTQLDLGVVWPSAVNIGTPPAAGTGSGDGAATDSDVVVLDSTLDLKAFVANPLAVINIRQQDRSQNLLADPRIRVKNREKAKVLIGEKVPVVTTTSTANVGVSSNVNFLDVGLTLEVEPLISLDDEVSIKVGLEVSNIIETVVFAGAQAFRLGRRTAATTLRLKDGETAVLAGLISDDERKTRVKVPGLGDVPALGRLFASDSDTSNRTEIVLLITPRIVRNIGRPELLQTQFPSGTEAAIGIPPLTIRTTPPKALGLSSRVPGAGGAVAPAPARAETAAAVPSELPGAAPAAVTIAAPTQVRVGQEFSVSVALPPGAGAGATLDLVYDPQVLAPVTAASTVTIGPGALVGGSSPPPQGQAVPGRESLRLTAGEGGAPAAAQVRFRVLASDGGSTQLSVDRLLVQDASGNPLPFVDPPPLRVAISQ